MTETPTARTRAINLLKDADLYIAMVAFVFIVLVTFLFVITRYFYSLSLPGLEEFTVIIFIWFLYFSMIYCMRKNAHIRVNVIDLIVPPKAAHAVTILSDVVLLAFNAGMVFFSARLVYFNIGPFGAKSIILGVPDFVVYAILPLSFTVFSVSIVMRIRDDFRTLMAPGGGPARAAVDLDLAEGGITRDGQHGRDKD